MAILCDGTDQPEYAFGEYFYPRADGLENVTIINTIENVINYVTINYLINYLIIQYNLWGLILTYTRVSDEIMIIPITVIPTPQLYILS